MAGDYVNGDSQFDRVYHDKFQTAASSPFVVCFQYLYCFGQGHFVRSRFICAVVGVFCVLLVSLPSLVLKRLVTRFMQSTDCDAVSVYTMR